MKVDIADFDFNSGSEQKRVASEGYVVCTCTEWISSRE